MPSPSPTPSPRASAACQAQEALCVAKHAGCLAEEAVAAANEATDRATKALLAVRASEARAAIEAVDTETPLSKEFHQVSRGNPGSYPVPTLELVRLHEGTPLRKELDLEPDQFLPRELSTRSVDPAVHSFLRTFDSRPAFSARAATVGGARVADGPTSGAVSAREADDPTSEQLEALWLRSTRVSEELQTFSRVSKELQAFSLAFEERWSRIDSRLEELAPQFVGRDQLQEAIACIEAKLENGFKKENDVLEAMETNLEAMEKDLEAMETEEPKLTRDCIAHLIKPKYELGESVWDSCLFMHLGYLSSFDTVAMLLCIISNFMFQMFFVSVCSTMGDSDFPPSLVQEMRKWRVTYGHGLEFAPSDDNPSLVASICGSENRGLIMEGNRQASIRDAISEFVDGQGALLTILAVGLWLMTIFIEAQNIRMFASAIWTKVGPGHTNLALLPDSNGLVLERISRFRAVAIMFLVSLPRFVVAAVLGYYGTLYLLATSSPADLVLNAMALEVVLNVDEMIYAALAPDTMKQIVSSLEPIELELPSLPSGLWPVCRAGILASVLGIFFAIPLQDKIETINSVERELCGGSTDFVFRQDLSSRFVVHVGAFSPHDGTLGFESLDNRAVLQATRQEMPVDRQHLDMRSVSWGSGNWMNDAELLYTRSDFSSLTEWRSLAARTLGESAQPRACADFDSVEAFGQEEIRATAAAMQEIFGLTSPPGCADLEPQCWEKSGASGGDDSVGSMTLSDFARLACPHTCGCDDIDSGQLLHYYHFGCPEQCYYAFGGRILGDSGTCADKSDDDLRNYIALYRAQFASVLPDQTGAAEGCEYFLSPASKMDESTGNASVCDIANAITLYWQGYRAVRPLCPVTCGCVQGLDRSIQGLECPGACL